jgi:hypothetical protein
LALANNSLACARYFRNVIFFDHLIINNPVLFRAKEKGKGKQKKISTGIGMLYTSILAPTDSGYRGRWLFFGCEPSAITTVFISNSAFNYK